jgi:hypothetical protein
MSNTNTTNVYQEHLRAALMQRCGDPNIMHYIQGAAGPIYHQTVAAIHPGQIVMFKHCLPAGTAFVAAPPSPAGLLPAKENDKPAAIAQDTTMTASSSGKRGRRAQHAVVLEAAEQLLQQIVTGIQHEPPPIPAPVEKKPKTVIPAPMGAAQKQQEGPEYQVLSNGKVRFRKVIYEPSQFRMLKSVNGHEYAVYIRERRKLEDGRTAWELLFVCDLEGEEYKRGRYTTEHDTLDGDPRFSPVLDVADLNLNLFAWWHRQATPPFNVKPSIFETLYFPKYYKTTGRISLPHQNPEHIYYRHGDWVTFTRKGRHVLAYVLFASRTEAMYRCSRRDRVYYCVLTLCEKCSCDVVYDEDIEGPLIELHRKPLPHECWWFTDAEYFRSIPEFQQKLTYVSRPRAGFEPGHIISVPVPNSEQRVCAKILKVVTELGTGKVKGYQASPRSSCLSLIMLALFIISSCRSCSHTTILVARSSPSTIPRTWCSARMSNGTLLLTGLGPRAFELFFHSFFFSSYPLPSTL